MRFDKSAIFFNTKTKDREEGNSRIPSKRKRDELTPTILPEQTSTSALVREEDTETTCSRHPRSTDKNEELIALKTNRLKDKAVMYKSHKDFLSRCIAEDNNWQLRPRLGWHLVLKVKNLQSNINERYCSSL